MKPTYEIENFQFFNADNMLIMKQYPDKYFQLAITDPPYGIKRDGGFGGFGGFGKPIARKQYKGKWDDKTPTKEYFNEILRISENVIIWGGNFFTDKLPVSGHWIFWDKLNTMPTFGDGELAYTSFNRNSVKRIVIEYNGLLGKEKEKRIHATQKPVKLYEWLLMNYAKPNDKIIDTHLGSGGIAIAIDKANQLEKKNLSFVGIELDTDYFNASIERFLNHKLQLTMF
jgi:site-specific DNA-methyltransferase (adenine-specific)